MLAGDHRRTKRFLTIFSSLPPSNIAGGRVTLHSRKPRLDEGILYFFALTQPAQRFPGPTNGSSITHPPRHMQENLHRKQNPPVLILNSLTKHASTAVPLISF